MKISDKTIKALNIIKANPGIRPLRFAEIMWAGSDSWQKVGRIGRGVTRGVGLMLKGGGYLGKLKQEKLVNAFTEVSEYGFKVLAEHPRQEMPK